MYIRQTLPSVTITLLVLSPPPASKLASEYIVDTMYYFLRLFFTMLSVLAGIAVWLQQVMGPDGSNTSRFAELARNNLYLPLASTIGHCR